MKSTIFQALLLCLNFFAQAQSGTQNSRLKVGDKAPALTVYKWLKGEPVAEFKKGQTYVVEFGATWCQPCAAAIPHLTKLARQYGSGLSVIGVFVMEPKKDSTDLSYVANAASYVRRHGDSMDYHVAVDRPDDRMQYSWISAAGLYSIPITFIVDKDGYIAWIGNANPDRLSQLVAMAKDKSYTLQDAIEGSRIADSLKESVIDPFRPLFVNGNGGDGQEFLFRSMLLAYHGEQAAGNTHNVYNARAVKYDTAAQSYAEMVQQVGVPISKLYYMAYADTLDNGTVSRGMDGEFPDTVQYPILRSSYGRYWYTPLLQVADSSPFQFDPRSTANRYTYTLILPEERKTARELQLAMQRDLKTYFGYTVIVKDSLMPYWRLVNTGKAEELLKAKTPGKKYHYALVSDTLNQFSNAVMRDLLFAVCQMNFTFGHSSFGVKPRVEAPFIDETGIREDIDYSISMGDLNKLRKGDWNKALALLHRYGLDLQPGKRKTKLVIIRDPEKE